MIQVERLTKKFQTHTALNQISVSVQPGSVFGLVGSNGAGKSTLLRTIAGIYKPDSGTVAIDGTPIFEHPNVKNDIFFISDFPYFIPQSNMKEMAKFYASMYSNWSHERYRELCNLFPIEEKMGLSAAQMVGNEDIIDGLEKEAQELVNERIIHEMNRILNGYGG